MELDGLSLDRSHRPKTGRRELVESGACPSPRRRVGTRRTSPAAASSPPDEQPPLLPPWIASFLVCVICCRSAIGGRDEIIEDVLLLQLGPALCQSSP